LEWGSIKIIISQAADESSGKYKEFTQKKIQTMWDDETKLIEQQKCITQEVTSKIIYN